MCFCIMGTAVIGTAISCVSGVSEKVGEALNANYYLSARKVLHGLPWSVVGSVAMGYIFNIDLTVGATYGIINYSLLTFLTECQGVQTKNENEELVTGLMLGTSYLIGTIFVNTLLKTNLLFLSALPLAVGAFIGHRFRMQVAQDITAEEHNYNLYLYNSYADGF